MRQADFLTFPQGNWQKWEEKDTKAKIHKQIEEKCGKNCYKIQVINYS